jgi:hypothetical protein
MKHEAPPERASRPPAARAGARGLLRAALGLAALAGAAGCGNYTNEDVEYQLALPEEQDLSVKLPTRHALVADSAEYYVETRKVVTQFNGLLDALLGLIDHVRAQPPSERRQDARVWGPYPHDSDRRWEFGMAMERVPDPTVPRAGARFVYAVKFRPRGSGESGWLTLISGFFAPSGGVRQGIGQLVLDLGAARRARLPVSEFHDLARLSIDYRTMGFPVHVTMRIWNVGSPEDRPDATYQYLENMDGSGEMMFEWRVFELPGAGALIYARWQSGGAGQAEARATGLPAPANLLGLDCWGPDTRETYSLRVYGARRNAPAGKGDRASCVYGAP